MNGEQKKVNFIDSSYLIPEMIDELDAANANLSIVITQQKHLVKLVSKDPQSKEILAGFGENVGKQIEDMEHKVHINNYRKECLGMLLAAAKDNPAVRFGIAMLLEGLGIVNKDAVPYDQRPELVAEKEVEEAIKEEDAEGQSEKKDA